MEEKKTIKPLISVIVPVYNVAEYVERCVNSILVQTYPYWELILVDDGSTDGSGDRCDELSKKDDRIKVVHQENGGVSSARRRGLLFSKGEYITFLDSDDALRPNAIEILYNCCLEYKVDVVIGDFESNSGGEMRQLHSNRKTGLLNKEEYVKSTVLLNLSMSTQARLYKRSLFDSIKLDIDRRIVQNEDFLWNLIISYNVTSAIVLDEVVYSVYARQGSASRTSRGFDYWQFFFTYIEQNLEAFHVREDYYMLFKITRIADMMRNEYQIDFRNIIFNNIRDFGYNRNLKLWGFFVVFFSRYPQFGKLQSLLKIHPSIIIKSLR